MRTKRTESGSQMIELIGGLFLMVPIVFFFLDMEILLIAKWSNNNLAREAARMASQGRPGILQVGKNRVVMHRQSPYLRACTLIEKEKPASEILNLDDQAIVVTESVDEPVPSLPYGGPVSGSVTVKTTMQVRPRFILPFLHKEAIEMVSIETCPYTWAMRSSLVPIPQNESK